jgi:hypothetical protein
MEKTVIEHGSPSAAWITTCAYCGVGCSFKAELQGRRGRAHGPRQGRQGQPRPLLRQGPLRLGLRHPPRPHHQADDPRSHHRPLARGQLGGGDRRRRHRAAAHPGRARAGSVGGITSSRCTNEETYLVQKLVRAAFGNNNVDTCARVCHSPTGYGLKQTWAVRRHPGLRLRRARRRDHGHRRQPDRRPPGVRLADEAPPARGRPAHRRRPAPHRPGALARTSRRPTTCRCARAPTSRWSTRWPTSSSPRAGRRGLRRRALRPDSFARWRDFIAPRRKNMPRRPVADHRRARRAVRGAARLYATGRQRGHLLRPGRHRAQPGLDHGHGHRQPRHGHRQHRPPRRGREPAARAEQRAGLLRHGLLPARAARLPARLRRPRCAPLRGRLGRRSIPSRACASPTCSTPPRRHLQGHLRPGRGHRPVRPEHQHVTRAPPWSA